MNEFLETIKYLHKQIKFLEQKKTSLCDDAEIKAMNKKINELQKKCGSLKKENRNTKAFQKSVEREFDVLLGSNE